MGRLCLRQHVAAPRAAVLATRLTAQRRHSRGGPRRLARRVQNSLPAFRGLDRIAGAVHRHAGWRATRPGARPADAWDRPRPGRWRIVRHIEDPYSSITASRRREGVVGERQERAAHRGSRPRHGRCRSSPRPCRAPAHHNGVGAAVFAERSHLVLRLGVVPTASGPPSHRAVQGMASNRWFGAGGSGRAGGDVLAGRQELLANGGDGVARVPPRVRRSKMPLRPQSPLHARAVRAPIFRARRPAGRPGNCPKETESSPAAAAPGGSWPRIAVRLSALVGEFQTNDRAAGDHRGASDRLRRPDRVTDRIGVVPQSISCVSGAEPCGRPTPRGPVGPSSKCCCIEDAISLPSFKWPAGEIASWLMPSSGSRPPMNT